MLHVLNSKKGSCCFMSSNKIKCLNCGFEEHHKSSNFCSYCGERLLDKNLCMNEDCENSDEITCDCGNEDIHCHLCGSYTLVGKYEDKNYEG